MKADKKRIEEKVDFLRQSPYLQHFPLKFVTKLQGSLVKVKYSKIGHKVMAEGHPVDYICFIESGEMEVVKEDLSRMDTRIFSFVE